MSGGLAPSRSTVYVGNLPFNLTNNDIHQVFETFGKIVKVTVLSDKYTRESKGVAFIQYIDRDAAINACKSVNQKQLFQRKIKCVIAKDNGRANEFIKKKEYPDKTTCYQCGQLGHMSYSCPNNSLGDREPPVKKEKKDRKRKSDGFINYSNTKKNKFHYKYDNEDEEEEENSPTEEGEDPRLSSLSSVVESEAAKYRHEQSRESAEPHGNFYTSFTSTSTDSEVAVEKKKLIKKSSYFSDEEEEFDGDG